MFKFIKILTTKHRGIVSCFLSDWLHPKSAVGSEFRGLGVRNMSRRSWAKHLLRIVHTCVDDFPTLKHGWLGGITT